MDTAIAEPPTKRKASRRKPINEERVVDLHNVGLTNAEIGKTQGVSQWTIMRFLEDVEKDFNGIETFKKHRADIFARIGAQNLDLQRKLLDKLNTEGILNALTPSQIASLTFALNSQHGTIYDKERLERGQSTQNHSIMTKMLHASVDSAMKSTASGIVALPPGDHNIVDEDELPPVDAPAQPPSVGEEAGRGDSLAADVSGHPTESTW